MIPERNLQLQQLGITRWTLRRPTVLQGENFLSFSNCIRLIIVADELFVLNTILISDVLRALKISTNQVLLITSDYVSMLPSDSYYNIWWLGGGKMSALKGSQLVSPILKELKTDPRAKSALWQQICKYERDFFKKTPENT